MSDSTTLVKVIAFLGSVMVVVALLPGTESAGTEWQAFQDTLSVGITFPEFVNPFEETSPTTNYLVVPTGAFFPSNPPESQTGCGAEYWNCINDFDESTYITLTFGVDSSVQVNVTPLGTPTRVVHYVVVHFWCRATTTFGQLNPSLGTTNFILTPAPGNPPDQRLRCFDGLNFTKNVLTIQTVQVGAAAVSLDVTDFWDDLIAGHITIVDGAVDTIDIAHVRLFVFASASEECGTIGDWWNLGDNVQVVGCQIGRFFDGIIKAILFFVNGVSWFLFSLGTVVIFIATVIATLFLGLGSIFSYLFNIGAPPFVQAIIDLFVIACVVLIIYLLVKVIRGPI